MEARLTELPEPLLALVVGWLPTARCVGRARLSCRALRRAMASDPEVAWGALAKPWLWRLRRRDDEACEALVRRAHVGQRHQFLVAVGGCDTIDRPLATCECLGLGSPSPRWRRAARMPEVCDAPGATSDSEAVYVLGGWVVNPSPSGRFAPTGSCLRAAAVDLLAEAPVAANDDDPDSDDDSSASDETHLTDSDEDDAVCEAWQPLPSLPVPRCFAATHTDGRRQLWALGGGDSLMRGAECFDEVLVLPPGDAWRAAGRMQRPRCGLALASDGRRDSLYLCGGYGGGVQYEPTVETFDPATGRGSLLPPMACARSGCGAAVGPDGALYVCGGSRDGGHATVSTERFDPREGRWQPLRQPSGPRAYLGACFDLDGKFYIAGGNGWMQQMLRTVEVYDPRADAWAAAPPLRRHRANTALLLVSA